MTKPVFGARNRALSGSGSLWRGSALVAMLAAPCLTGCALGSGVVPVGPDTYALSEMRAPVRGGGAEAERTVLAEADAFCRQQGRDVFLLDVRPDGDPGTVYWPTAFDATFQCRPASRASPG
jgi:hypothetical protein